MWPWISEAFTIRIRNQPCSLPRWSAKRRKQAPGSQLDPTECCNINFVSLESWYRTSCQSKPEPKGSGFSTKTSANLHAKSHLLASTGKLENFSWESLYLGSLGMCLALTSVPILRNIENLGLNKGAMRTEEPTMYCTRSSAENRMEQVTKQEKQRWPFRHLFYPKDLCRLQSLSIHSATWIEERSTTLKTSKVPSRIRCPCRGQIYAKLTTSLQVVRPSEPSWNDKIVSSCGCVTLSMTLSWQKLGKHSRDLKGTIHHVPRCFKMLPDIPCVLSRSQTMTAHGIIEPHMWPWTNTTN